MEIKSAEAILKSVVITPKTRNCHKLSEQLHIHPPPPKKKKKKERVMPKTTPLHKKRKKTHQHLFHCSAVDRFDANTSRVDRLACSCALGEL